MTLTQFGAGFVLSGKDMASPVVKRVGASFMGLERTVNKGAMGMNKALGALTMGLASLKVGTDIVGFGRSMADSAAEFEQGLAGVGAISRATADELTMLHDASIDAALGTKFSPDQAVEGLTNLATAGLKAKQSVEVLRPVLDLATGSLGQLGLADAANAVVGTLKAMDMQITDTTTGMNNATVVTDKLLKITQLTNFQTRDFEVGLSRAASTAKLYDQSLDDTLITMGLLRNSNIEASVASTSLREAWRRLATDQKAQQEIQKRGVDIFDSETGEIRDMLSIMTDLSVKTQDLNDKERMRMTTIAFGVRGMAAFNSVANATYTAMVRGEEVTLKGMDAINAMRYELSETNDALDDTAEKSLKAALGVDDLSEALKNSTGTAADFAEQLLDTYAGQKELLGGSFQTFVTVLGEAAAQLYKPAVRALYLLFEGLANMMNSIPVGARKVIIGIVTALGLLISLAGGILVLQGAMNLLGLSFGGIAVSMLKFLAIAAPAMVLMGGLAIGAYALYRALSRTNDAGDSWREMLNKIKVGWQAMMAVITGEPIDKELEKQITEAGMQGFVKRFENFWERMSAVWDGVREGFETGIIALADSPAFQKLKTTLNGVLEIFTGTDMENSQEALDGWKEKGVGAGLELAKLGETAADVLNTMLELGAQFAEFTSRISGDDVTGAIENFVLTFDVLAESLNIVYTAFMGIFQAVRLVVSALWDLVKIVTAPITGIVELLNLAGDEKFENFGQVFDQWKTNMGDFIDPFANTADAAGALADVYTARADRGANLDMAAAGRRRRETQARSQFATEEMIRQYQDAKGRLERVIHSMVTRLSTGGEAQTPEEAAQRQQATKVLSDAVANLENMTKKLTELSGKPIVMNIDGEKVGEIIGRTPSFTGEDDLDEISGVALP